MPEQHYRLETYVSVESVGYLVRRLYAVLLARFDEALAHEHVTLTQWIVLIQLSEGRATTASDIAHDLQHDTGALTRVIDQLELRGLVARTRSRSDRRVVRLELTREGHAMVRKLLPMVVDLTNDALAPLTATEFARFRDYLMRLLEHAQAGPTHTAQSPATPPDAGEARAQARNPPRARTARGNARKRIQK